MAHMNQRWAVLVFLLLSAARWAAAEWQAVRYSNCAGPQGTFAPTDAIAFYNATTEMLTISVRGLQSDALEDIDPESNVQCKVSSERVLVPPL
jgi:hypothetical protein